MLTGRFRVGSGALRAGAHAEPQQSGAPAGPVPGLEVWGKGPT